MSFTSFNPQVHGFHCRNRFAHFTADAVKYMGLCGGMAFSSLDYFYAGIPIPTHRSGDFGQGHVAPARGTRLYKQIYNRMAATVLQNFGHWFRVHADPLFNMVRFTSKKIPELLETLDQGRPVPPGLAAPALRALALARFPLNVRELQKAIVSAAALAAPGALVQVEDLPEGLFAPPASVITERLPETVRAVVVTPSGRKAPEPAPAAEVLERLLRLHEGNVADVARALGRQRAAIWRWIKRYGINPEKFRTL